MRMSCKSTVVKLTKAFHVRDTRWRPVLFLGKSAFLSVKISDG